MNPRLPGFIKQKHLTILFAVAALIVAVSVFMSSRQTLEPRERADPTDPRQVALGRAVYAQHCASCHGANLEGQPNWRRRRPDGRLPAPPHDETGHTWEHTDETLFQVTKRGVQPFVSAQYETDMNGFANVLSDEEIWAVIAFIKSTWPPALQRRHPTDDASITQPQ